MKSDKLVISKPKSEIYLDLGDSDRETSLALPAFTFNCEPILWGESVRDQFRIEANVDIGAGTRYESHAQAKLDIVDWIEGNNR